MWLASIIHRALQNTILYASSLQLYQRCPPDPKLRGQKHQPNCEFQTEILKQIQLMVCEQKDSLEQFILEISGNINLLGLQSVPNNAPSFQSVSESQESSSGLRI